VADVGFENEVTERVFRYIVDNQDRHEDLLKKITGRDPEGERDEVIQYLRDAEQAGDPWLVAALTGRSAFEVGGNYDDAETWGMLQQVNVAELVEAFKGYPRAV